MQHWPLKKVRNKVRKKYVQGYEVTYRLQMERTLQSNVRCEYRLGYKKHLKLWTETTLRNKEA